MAGDTEKFVLDRGSAFGRTKARFHVNSLIRFPKSEDTRKNSSLSRRDPTKRWRRPQTHRHELIA